MADISVILNMHREGALARASFRSIEMAAAKAESSGKTVEVIVVLDCGDLYTRRIAKEWTAKTNAKLLEVTNGDPGLSRNSGVTAARGEWIAFLDADDMWGSNWLVEAHRAGSADKRQVVWHPEANLYFGVDTMVLLHPDMEGESYDPLLLATTNYWTALSFSRRKFLLDYPFQKSDIRSQIGFEDWSWNIDAIASGAIHKIVPDTAHAVRVKRSSQNRSSWRANAMPHATDLFRNMIARPAAH